jgi:hypothetical protein
MSSSRPDLPLHRARIAASRQANAEYYVAEQLCTHPPKVFGCHPRLHASERFIVVFAAS